METENFRRTPRGEWVHPRLGVIVARDGRYYAYPVEVAVRLGPYAHWPAALAALERERDRASPPAP